MKTSRSKPETLSREDLNRATLARQMLLERAKLAPDRAIERLAGMQAQLARPPFIGLWSRLVDFKRESLVRALERKQVVRATAMRGTLHLLSARDYLAMRAALQPGLSATALKVLRQKAQGIDAARVTEAARELLVEPLTFDELRPRLARVFPKLDVRALGYTVRTNLPLVQVPVAGSVWGFPAAAAFAMADRWLGAACAPATPHELVVHYLAAYGPASVEDAQTWWGLGNLRAVFDELRPRLTVFADETDRELFDVADGPRPTVSTPTPPRFLPEYDNLVLAFADRRRLVADEHRPKLITKNLQIPATFLVDGRIAGTWKIVRSKKAATLAIAAFGRIAKPALEALATEAAALVRFVEPDAETFDVQLPR